MGRLDAFTDMTGKMSMMELNGQNIQQILDELNRNSDQLDSVQNNLAVVSSGKTSITSPGGFVFLSSNVVHGLGFPPAVLAFYTIASAPSVVRQVPNYVLDGAGAFLYYVIFSTTSNNIIFELQGNTPATTFNISYYLLKQPANLTSISL